MNSNFSIQVQRVLQLAREEAHKMHSSAVRLEHLMLGVVKDGQGIAWEALLRLDTDMEMLRQRLEQTLYNTTSDQWDSISPNEGNATDTLDQKETPLSRESDRTLKLSMLEARMLRSSEVGSEHIVLAMLKDESSALSQILIGFGINYKTFYEAIAQIKHLNPEQQNNTNASSLNSFARQEQEILDKQRKEEMRGEEGDEEFTDSYESDEDEEDMTYSPGDQAQRQQQKQQGQSNTPALDKFGFDMTRAAEEGKLDPVVGREVEIERLSQILSRRKKNNPILIGEPGVGKSAIVEGLATRIVQKRVSWLLQGKRVVSLDMAALVAGTKYRGQFEERLKAVVNELQQNQDIILYIDEIHTMVGAGNAQGAMDAANMLKPVLSRGEIQCIGSTTIDEYRKTIEKDGALERRFQKVMVEPTNREDTLTILHNIKSRYEEHHNCTFTDDALQACVDLTDRYVTERNFPDKAIDAMDEAGSHVHLRCENVPASFAELDAQLIDCKRRKDAAILTQQFEEAASCRDEERRLEQKIKDEHTRWEQEQKQYRTEVGADEIAQCVAQMTGIPVTKVASSESQKLLQLRGTLQNQVIGQDEAIQKVVRAIQRNRIGLKDPNKPIGVFLFLGPTGVGKTYLAKKIAEEMFSAKDSLIRVDMSEFMEKYNVSRLIGAAPGYVGYDEGGQLTERVRRHPYSVVLFDEIEKAHPDIYNIMLQIFDEGHLTDANGRRINFKNTIIIMTSNVGSRQLKDFGTGIGFQQHTESDEKHLAQGVIQKALKKQFAPEFLNRIDDIITFGQLDHADIRKIVDLELEKVMKRIEKLDFHVEITDSTKDFLADKGYDRANGARPLKRAVQTYIEDALCEGILEHQHDAESSRRVKIDYTAGNESPSVTFE